MKKNKGKLGYAIPTLLAAGAIPFTMQTSAMDTEVSVIESAINKIKGIVLDINEQQTYSLAQHASHSSHGSHASHSSHGSHSSHNGINLVLPQQEINDDVEVLTASTRNENSTPRSTILPSTPAINGPKKLQRLPGNSQKFKDTLFQVQVALASRGFDVGDINGEMHARTIAAVYEYQTSSDLMPSGKLTTETLSSLNILVL